MSSFPIRQVSSVGTAVFVAGINHPTSALKNNNEYKTQVTRISCKNLQPQTTGISEETRMAVASSLPNKIPVRLTLSNRQYA
jgi:hypothetical protein